jgi:hypothetical protein
VLRHVRVVRIDVVTTQLGNKLRNPLAFVHGKLNLPVAQRMSKPLISSPEGTDRLYHASESSRSPALRRTDGQQPNAVPTKR